MVGIIIPTFLVKVRINKFIKYELLYNIGMVNLNVGIS